MNFVPDVVSVCLNVKVLRRRCLGVIRVFLTPSFEQEPSDKDKAAMLLVCPFNSSPAEEIEDEERIADIFLSEAPNYDGKVGRFYSSFVGYAKNFRNTSSSGGLATFIFQQLLEQKNSGSSFCCPRGSGDVSVSANKQ